MPDLLHYRLLHCNQCGNRTWIDNQTAPTCACGARDWWEDHEFVANDRGPGLSPVQTDRPERPSAA